MALLTFSKRTLILNRLKKNSIIFPGPPKRSDYVSRCSTAAVGQVLRRRRQEGHGPQVLPRRSKKVSRAWSQSYETFTGFNDDYGFVQIYKDSR